MGCRPTVQGVECVQFDITIFSCLVTFIYIWQCAYVCVHMFSPSKQIWVCVYLRLGFFVLTFIFKWLRGPWLSACMPDHSPLMMPPPKGTRQNGKDDSSLWTCVCDVKFSHINHSVRQWEQGAHGVKRRHGPLKPRVLAKKRGDVRLALVIIYPNSDALRSDTATLYRGARVLF